MPITREQAEAVVCSFPGVQQLNDQQLDALIRTVQTAVKTYEELLSLQGVLLATCQRCPTSAHVCEVARSMVGEDWSLPPEWAAEARRARRAKREAAIDATLAERPELGPLRRKTGICRCGHKRRGCRVGAARRVVLVETCEVCGHGGYLTEQATGGTAPTPRPAHREEAAPAAAKASGA